MMAKRKIDAWLFDLLFTPIRGGNIQNISEKYGFHMESCFSMDCAEILGKASNVDF